MEYNGNFPFHTITPYYALLVTVLAILKNLWSHVAQKAAHYFTALYDYPQTIQCYFVRVLVSCLELYWEFHNKAIVL